MNCGIPFCHNGCPVNNQIPDWNDLVYRGDWHEALQQPALDQQLPGVHRAHLPGAVRGSRARSTSPTRRSPSRRSNAPSSTAAGPKAGSSPSRRRAGPASSVAVIGSGPAGLACAQQLARAGHEVHVYEKNAKPGGLLRYGIPDFKMEKRHIDAPRRRRWRPRASSSTATSMSASTSTSTSSSHRHDAVALAGGAEKPRDLPIPGRDLDGIHFAMEFLPQQNRRVSDEPLGNVEPILAGGKHVVVIGGGDTGSDCIGTSNRQGALSVTQLEILPRPPEQENKPLIWPDWPLKLRTSSSQEEGVDRDFSVLTEKFTGDDDGRVKLLHCVRVDDKMKPIAGSEFDAQGRPRAPRHGLPRPGAGRHDQARSASTSTSAAMCSPTPSSYQTSLDKVFACGDMRRGQSLVVWAIREGRQARARSTST